MPTGTDDVPREVQDAIRAAINKAFDALPFEQRPENKMHNPDSFGQHKVNLDDSTHNFKTAHSYERLYLSPTPSQSQRGGSTKCSDGRSRGKRYPDEVEANFPFLGIALGRRETITDGSAPRRHARADGRRQQWRSSSD